MDKVCDACNGTGQYVDYPAVTCPKCGPYAEPYSTMTLK